jgi:hypothetical protein
VKRQKKDRNLPIGQDKNSDNKWKAKAIERGKEIQTQKKRISELIASRDKWKSKSKSVCSVDIVLSVSSGQKAKGHHYSLVFVLLMLEFQRYGSMSLRSSRHCIGCMLITMGISVRIPSHSSIRNWLCKHGYNRIVEVAKKVGNYVVYVDESISFGSEKILLILGLQEVNIPTQRAINQSDVEVLFVGISQEWKSTTISVELEKIAQQKQIMYVVSDEGTNLKKAYLSAKNIHIEDCTHIFANHLKKLYNKDPDFESFRKLIGKLRQNWNLSKENSQYMPPSMRGKMRFANIFPCVDWADSCLKKWDNFNSKQQESLSFLKEHFLFIEQLVSIGKIFKYVCGELKTIGFGLAQRQKIEVELARFKTGENTLIFIENIKSYLKNLTDKSQLLGQSHLLCSSDIIESYFGKFKAKINPNSRSGLTEFLFTIANFSGNFSLTEVKTALENIKIKDLKHPDFKTKMRGAF